MPVLAFLAVVPIVPIGVIGVVLAARPRESRPGPVAEFVRRMQGAFARAGVGRLTRAMKLLTQMGNNRETQILTVVPAAGVGAV